MLSRPRPSSPARAVRDDVRAALPAWLVGRAIVAASLAAAHLVARYLEPLPEPVDRHVRQGLLGWDAERYLQIASTGYAPLPRIELRFFPLFPLLIRAADRVLPGDAGTAALVLAHLAALALGALLHRLVLHETGDVRLASRATWFAAVMPVGFVFAWGYTEAPWAALCAATVLCARRGRWWAAAALALPVGLLRPVGVLLAAPLAIEAMAAMRRSRRPWLAPVGATVAPVAGTAVYLGWVWHRFGDPLLPYEIQQTGRFRGETVDPVRALWRHAVLATEGTLSIDSLRVGWVLCVVALLVVCWRRWPPSYAAFASISVLVALSTSRLGSFERYAFTPFPVLLALATVSNRPWVERSLLGVGATAMSLYGLLALLGPYTP